MKKMTFVIFLIMLTGMIISFINLKSEETQPQKPSPAVKSTPSLSQTEEETASDILSDIRRAQQMLEKEDAGCEIHEKNKKGKWEMLDFQVLLAVRHVNGKIKIISVDPKTKQVNQSGYVVDWSKPNGVNTGFSIIYPKDCVVLAIKRVVRDDKEVFKEVIYTPYSPAIECELLRNTGLSYLKKTIETANDQLRNVKSQSNSEQSVAETVPSDLALVLAIIEHIDPDRLLRGEPIQKLINEVLVVIGANEQSAYRYCVSEANARGLFQFIPSTYKMICGKYEDAGLKKDFVEGMNDHLNAAKASLLLFDSDLSYLKDQKITARNDLVLGKHLASAYNCGAKRTAKEIRSHKGFWERKVPLETQLYLRKFSAAWHSLIGA